jgi:hypothetical protein
MYAEQYFVSVLSMLLTQGSGWHCLTLCKPEASFLCRVSASQLTITFLVYVWDSTDVICLRKRLVIIAVVAKNNLSNSTFP